MASFRKRRTKAGEDRWEVQVRLRGSAPLVSTHRRLSDARRWAAEQESQVRERRMFGRSGPTRRTVAEAIDRYTSERLSDLAPSEQGKRRGTLGWWRARLGNRKLFDLTPDDIASALADLAALGLSPARQNRYVAAMSKVLTIAVREWRWLGHNVARDVTRRREPPGRVRVLREDELERIVAACRESDSPILAPLVALALATAARQGELLALDWRDVDLERGIATLRQTKNRTDRTIPLGDSARRVLAGMKPQDSGLVFGGSAFPVRAWRVALVAAKIEAFRFHDLRHCAASMLAMSGATPRELAEILGHKTLAMVMRYSHFYDSHLSGLMEKMNARFLKPTSRGGARAKR